MSFSCRIDRLNHYLKERYAVVEEVGRGGSAVVFRATDMRHRREVALKVLDPALVDQIGLDRFAQEIEITAGLQHPHILPLLDSGQVDGMVFFVTPFVGGGSLRDRLRAKGPLSVVDALRVARQVGGGLAYAHRQGVVHLDVKPENILLSDGHAVVADFGIARAFCDTCPIVVEEDAPAVGTPAYMSPEQAAGSAVDARSDVYSFACLVYELLAGRPPFVGITPEQILARHLVSPITGIRSVRRDVPARVDRVLVASLAKDPGDRPASMDAVVACMAAGTGRPARRSAGRRIERADLLRPAS